MTNFGPAFEGAFTHRQRKLFGLRWYMIPKIARYREMLDLYLKVGAIVLFGIGLWVRLEYFL